MTISEEDFDLMPIFTNRGGLGKARKVFGEQLPTLIEELNLLHRRIMKISAPNCIANKNLGKGYSQ